MPKLCSIVLGMVLAATPVLASAQAARQPPRTVSAEDLKLAEQHFTTACAAFESENWLVANVEFSAAYKLTDKYPLLHNLSLTAERQGQLSEAIRYAQAFLTAAQACTQSVPPTCEPLPQTEADQLKGRLARLQAQLGDSQKPPGPSSPADLAADTAGPVPRNTAPQSAHALTNAQPAHVPKTRHPVNEHSKGLAGPLALLGVGGALLAVGIGCGVGALGIQNTITDGGAYFPNDYQSLVDRGSALNGAAIGFDVGGAVLLASGTTWAIVHRIRQAKNP